MSPGSVFIIGELQQRSRCLLRFGHNGLQPLPYLAGLIPDASSFAVFLFGDLSGISASQLVSICVYHLFAASWCVPLLPQPSSADERDGADRTVHGSFLLSGRLSFPF